MYYNRELESLIFQDLNRDEIQVIIGARQTGKTTLLQKIQDDLNKEGKTTFYINLENPTYLNKLNEHPDQLFEITGDYVQEEKYYIFIDEVQYLDNPSNFLKYIFDEYKGKVKLLVSGSSAFYIDQKFKDSLVGRKKLYELHYLTFQEFLRFKEAEGLLELFNNKKILTEKRKIPLIHFNEVKQIFNEFILYGGYPGVVIEKETKNKIALLEEFYRSSLSKDIVYQGIKNKTKFYMLIRILAEQTGSLFNCSELSNSLGLSVTAVENYIYILERAFIIKRIKPFFKNLRKELTKMPKIYFSDLGFRNIILDNFRLLEERLDKGAYLENIIFILLNCNVEIKDISYWRTQDKNEIDFIVNKNEALEIKFDSSKFSATKYKKFTEAYPEIPLNIVSYDLNNQEYLNPYDFL